MIVATSVEFFKNLAQCDYDNIYYDFHNNYNCEKLSYSNGIFLILFKSLIGGNLLSLKFTDVEMIALDFVNVRDIGDLTVDNLYRGRYELNGSLIDASENGKACFYLQFYEGHKFEFWASGIGLEHG